MKRLLLIPALLLASCAPLVSNVQRAVVLASLDRGDVLVPAGDSDLTGDPSRTGDGVSLVIQGTAEYTPDAAGLTVCAAVLNKPGRFACNLGAIPALKSYRVATAAGSVTDLLGSGYRAGSALPVPIVLLR